MSNVTPTLLSEGRPIDITVGIVSIDVTKELNRIPRARIILCDGDPAKGVYDLSNEPVFEPGKEVEVQVRYEQEKADVTIFKGLVVKQTVSADTSGSSLIVDLKDKTFKSTLVRKRKIYRDMTDKEIVEQILLDNGLEVGKLKATQGTHAELVQFDSSDWDFVLSRAEANGLFLAASDGIVSTAKPDLSGSADHSIEYGISSVYAFDIEVDAEAQLPGVESIAWDIAAQSATQPAAGTEFALAQGNLKGSALAKAIGLNEPSQLTNTLTLSKDELKAWSDGQLMRSRLAMIRGRISLPGLGKISLLEQLEISGIGDRFNGKAIISGIRHRIDENGWQTDIQLGLSAKLLAERRDMQPLPAGGLLPAVNGLQIGVVTSFEEDPAGELRAKIILPTIDMQDGVIWARLVSPEAGNGRGFFFRPEVGDEVVVGFLNDDPRQSIVLGSLFSSANQPASPFVSLAEENINKGIVTKSGTTIHFIDDEKASLIIHTPSENKIVLSDDEELIDVTDQHGNQIQLSGDGISIISTSDLKIEAAGKVEITGQEVDIK